MPRRDDEGARYRGYRAVERGCDAYPGNHARYRRRAGRRLPTSYVGHEMPLAEVEAVHAAVLVP